MNLRSMLESAAERYRDKTAIIMGERRLSYAQLDEMANRVANGLVGLGVEKGERVALLLNNSPEFVTSYFGIVKMGAIAVPLDPKYKLTELNSIFADCQPKVLVAENQFLAPLVPALKRFNSLTEVIAVSAEDKTRFLAYDELIAASSSAPVNIELRGEDIAHIAYTSGPSLNPRGVMMSHQALVREATISGNGFGQTEKDVVMLFALPMHHAFGLVVVMLSSINKGSTVVMLPGLSISNLLEVMEKERVTIFMGVPFVHALIAEAFETEGVRHDLSSVRLWGTAGAPMPVDILRKLRERFGLTVVDFWGLTESAAHVTCQSLDGGGKLGSVGKALPGWELKIVDEEGRELPPNQPGEIIVRGPIMSGYYNNPGATAGAIKNGWLHTGDIGWLDEEGWLFLLPKRKRDMLIVKGQNIYPGDIELVLSSHPKVAEAAVVGAPDRVRGEIPIAFIKLRAGEVVTEQELKHFCLEHLANYKVPKEVIFVDFLPRTAEGRIDKEALLGRGR